MSEMQKEVPQSSSVYSKGSGGSGSSSSSSIPMGAAAKRKQRDFTANVVMAKDNLIVLQLDLEAPQLTAAIYLLPLFFVETTKPCMEPLSPSPMGYL